MPVIKQWVNLSPTSPEDLRNVPGEGVIPPERCGPEITLQATINPPEPNKRVYWGVQLDSNNVENTLASGSGWTLNPAQGGFGAPGFYEKLVLTNDAGESNTTFLLSICGGDKFTIKAFTKNDDGSVRSELSSEIYEVWRQLYYQVTRMDALGSPGSEPAVPDIVWDDLKNEYNDLRRPHNIRWSEVPAASAMITRHRSLWNDDLVKHAGLEGYDRTKEPLVLKVSLVEMLAARAQEDHTFDVVRRNRTYRYNIRNVLFDCNSADDRDDWFLSASAYERGDAGQTISITRDNFSKEGGGTITVNLKEVPRCKRASVEVDFYIFESSTAGVSWYNGIWITSAQPTRAGIIQPSPSDEKIWIAVHEFGHAIGMVPSEAPYHYATSNGHGHRGGHCWNGATDPDTFPGGDKYSSLRTDGSRRDDGACCTMFGCVVSATEQFCDECSPFVRSRRPSWHGKFKSSSMMPANISSWGGTLHT